MKNGKKISKQKTYVKVEDTTKNGMPWEKAGKPLGKPLLEFLEELIITDQSNGLMLKVSVGTDSQKSSSYGGYKFATVIMITVTEDLGGGVIKGRGGKIISATYKLPVYGRNKEGVNERMMVEVGKSIEVAYEIASLLDKYGIKLEIHADINPDPQHESNRALSEAVGYILGMGFDFKIKPESWASSYTADRHCR